MNSSITKDDIICGDKFLTLESNDVLYLKTDILSQGMSNLYWRDRNRSIQPSKVWITGHSDYPIDSALFNKYHSNCSKWFTVNRDVSSPKVMAIPLGITNNTNESDLHPIYGNLDIMIEVMNQPRNIRNLVYLNFNINTFPSDRLQCYNRFHNKPYVTVGTIENSLAGRKKFLTEIRNHLFVLCPRGNGIDTHRLWETLYMGSIPIVKRCVALEEFTDLPILFINDWSDITNEKFLEDKYKEITSRSWNLDKLKFSYWEYQILQHSMS